MVHRLDMNQLRQALQRDLPGDAAKQEWMPRPPRRWEMSGPTRRASVLVLLVLANQDLRLPLIRRRVVEGDVHSGQISLPGGRREPGESSAAAALRESHEELGIDSARVELLGSLSVHRIPVSSYEVVPFVGTLEGPVGYWRDPREVESIFEVSLRDLLDPAAKVEVPLVLRGTEYLVPGWQLEEGLLWGATAMILGELLELVRPLLVGGGAVG